MTLLHRRDPQRNMARFYAVSVERSLFGEFMLVRQWGRIGSRGRMQADWFVSASEASSAEDRLLRSKRRRGYRDITGETALFRRTDNLGDARQQESLVAANEGDAGA